MTCTRRRAGGESSTPSGGLSLCTVPAPPPNTTTTTSTTLELRSFLQDAQRQRLPTRMKSLRLLTERTRRPVPDGQRMPARSARQKASPDPRLGLSGRLT
ncbi:hypothetical protein ZHAS_00016577 [Anopheles sinensis]|uniref:Uncharacterized protein n=1 Tax=Anopheles sinensis TaxID=74873 RepID=A0A084WEE7_ANOSI|nr:hypothetical protein ZHAS_00016577 [Anopheles sinensis]